MAPPQCDATMNEFRPLIGDNSVNYGTSSPSPSSSSPNADQDKDADVASTSPSLRTILRNAPSDLRGSLQSLRGLVHHHTGQIGYLGSFAIAANSLTGPAMLHLPATFQRSGVIPTLATLIFVCILAALCSLHLANTISKVPGNSNFKQEIEYSEVFRAFWGHQWFVVAQSLFFVCILCLNVSSIVDTAQTIDTCLGSLQGTWALQFGLLSIDNEPLVKMVHWRESECTDDMRNDGNCLPFFDDDDDNPETIILTLGYALTVAIFLPMALMDLKENAYWQIAGFAVLILASIQFSCTFAMNGLDFNNVSLWGESWSGLFGVILFNFALVIAIPAWLYEKEPNVDVPTVIHGSSALSLVLYIFVGGLGTLSMPNVSENMLESMESGVHGVGLQIGASIFAFFIVGLGIPLFGVLSRMSLTGSDLCSKPVANMLSVYLPFSIGWLLYKGEAVKTLLSWGGVICTSFIAFLLPLFVSLYTVNEFDCEGSVDVYPSCFPSLKSSKGAQIRALHVLLVLAIASVVAAIIGNVKGET